MIKMLEKINVKTAAGIGVGVALIIGGTIAAILHNGNTEVGEVVSDAVSDVVEEAADQVAEVVESVQ